MASTSRLGSKHGSKRARVLDTEDDSSGSDDEVPPSIALRKRMAPTLSRYPPISHKSEAFKQRYKALCQRPIKPNRYIDNELLVSLGLLDEVKQLLDNVGWADLLHFKECCYPQLTLEFLSSFMYQEGTGRWTFRIANIDHKLSNEQVGDMFGWSQETECVPNCFETSFWRELTGQPKVSYVAREATSAQIVNPAFRYLHRVLTHTLYGRGDSVGGVSKDVLKVLYGMHHSIKLDFTAFLAKRFTDVAKRSQGPIILGGFITQMAKKFGAFDCNKTNLVAVDGRILVDEATCLNMGLIVKTGRDVQLKTHPLDQLEDGTSQEQVGGSGDPSPSSETSCALGRIEAQLQDLHFKLDAYFSHVGFTPPPPH